MALWASRAVCQRRTASGSSFGVAAEACTVCSVNRVSSPSRSAVSPNCAVRPKYTVGWRMVHRSGAASAARLVQSCGSASTTARVCSRTRLARRSLRRLRNSARAASHSALPGWLSRSSHSGILLAKCTEEGRTAKGSSVWMKSVDCLEAGRSNGLTCARIRSSARRKSASLVAVSLQKTNTRANSCAHSRLARSVCHASSSGGWLGWLIQAVQQGPQQRVHVKPLRAVAVVQDHARVKQPRQGAQ